MKVERRHQNAKARVHFAEVGVDQHGIFVDLFPYVVHQQQKHAPWRDQAAVDTVGGAVLVRAAEAVRVVADQRRTDVLED